MLSTKQLLFLTVLSLVAAIGGSYYFVQFFPINIDVAIHVEIANRMWLGQQLYDDIVVVNPPLQYLLRMCAVALWKLCGISAKDASFIQDILYVSVFYLVTIRLWCRVFQPSRFMETALVLLVLASLFFISPFMFGDMQVFGQKEHLIFVGVVPYLLSQYLKMQQIPISRMERLLAFLGMAIACMIKPFYAILVIALQLVVVFSEESRKDGWQENIKKMFYSLVPFMVVGTAYLLFVALVYPDYFNIHLLYGNAYYQFQKAPLIFVYYKFIISVLPLVMMLYIINHSLGGTQYRYLLGMFSITVLITLIFIFLQGKMWVYHFYPSWMLFVLTAFIAFFSRIELIKQQYNTLKTVLVSVLCGLIIGGALYASYGSRELLSSYDEEKRLVQQLEENNVSDVYLIAQDLVVSRLLLEHKILWHNRFIHMWPFPGLQVVVDGVQSLDVNKDAIAALSSELTKLQPQYIIIQKEATDVDEPYYLRILQKDAELASILKHYHVNKVLSVDNYLVIER